MATAPNDDGAAHGGANRLGFQDSIVSHRNPWQPLSEAAQPFRLARADRHDDRAAALAPGSTGARWHAGRAAGLRQSLADRCADCESMSATFANRTTGEVITRPLGCGMRLCPRCSKRKARKVYRRLSANLEGTAAAQSAKNRTAHLVTFTVRSRDDLSAVARILRRAWPCFRASWHYTFGQALPFLRFEELAPGTTGKGHLHWHVLAFGPAWFPLKTAHRLWRSACMTARQALELTPDDQGQNLDLSRCKTGRPIAPGAASVAAYAAKVYSYISKESGDIAAIPPRIAAAYLDATYGLRLFTAARGILAAMVPGDWYLLAIGPTRPADAPPDAPQTSANGARAPPDLD